MILFSVCCYTPYEHVDNDDKTRLEKDVWQVFENGQFDCLFELDMKVWCCSTCCMITLWAETVSKSRVHSFWTAFFLFALCAFLNHVTYCFCYIGLFTLCLQLYFRQRLRRKLSIDACSCDALTEDLCFVGCCPCAAVAHEAHVV